jgi:hypothetical protein
MAQLKDFQTGAVGDSFNGPIGSTTASTGAFTTLTTTGTINNLTVGRGAGAVSTNTAVGASALAANTSGFQNTAVGYQALISDTSGFNNTALGYQALTLATSNSNTAVGVSAGGATTTGNVVAFGNSALGANTTGSNNTAVGLNALNSNTTASNNTAVGYQAGYTNATGVQNTFMGFQSGQLSTGNLNTYLGAYSGFLATSGINNTFLGGGAGYSMTTGSKNTIIGNYSGNQGGLDIRTSSNYIVLSDGDGNPWFYIRASGLVTIPSLVSTYTTASSANIFVNAANGEISRSTSALKYKQDIRDLESIDIDLFRAVRYKSKCDGDNPTKDHFGVIADEVDAAGINELVTYGVDGEVEGFQYERLTVVLLKELQTLRARVAQLESK